MSIAVGDIVFSNWGKDEYWYAAVVTEIAEEVIHVIYFDGDFEMTTIDRVKPYAVEVGMLVQGLWDRENYYRAEILKINGPSFKLKFFDGDIAWLPLSLIRWSFER